MNKNNIGKVFIIVGVILILASIIIIAYNN